MIRVRTVEYDPRGGGWIARNPYTGKEIVEEGFRWHCRESARCAVWEARHLSAEAKAARGVTACPRCNGDGDLPDPSDPHEMRRCPACKGTGRTAGVVASDGGRADGS